jgi:hypothetical protein
LLVYPLPFEDPTAVTEFLERHADLSR